jgi:hypothetical protein
MAATCFECSPSSASLQPSSVKLAAINFKLNVTFYGCETWSLIFLQDIKAQTRRIYRVIIKSLYTWWLQYTKLQVMFKESPASLQIFDTRLTLTPSIMLNSNYVIMVSDWNCLKYLCVFFYYVIILCTETFWSPGIWKDREEGWENTNSRIWKGKSIPLQAWKSPEGYRRLSVPDFKAIGN